MKDIKEMSYNEAIAETEQILRTMQGDQCDIDRLAEMTRRATEPTAARRRRLTATAEQRRRSLETPQ